VYTSSQYRGNPYRLTSSWDMPFVPFERKDKSEPTNLVIVYHLKTVAVAHQEEHD